MPVTIEDIHMIVRLQLGRKKVSGQNRFLEDLGAESADIVNMIASAEDKYQISFDEEDISGVRTVTDLFNTVKRLMENGMGGD
jgi:acyl carrier protein